jgi:hypothetical protein
VLYILIIPVRQLKQTAKDSKTLNSASTNENIILCRCIYATDMQKSPSHWALAHTHSKKMNTHVRQLKQTAKDIGAINM